MRIARSLSDHFEPLRSWVPITKIVTDSCGVANRLTQPKRNGLSQTRLQPGLFSCEGHVLLRHRLKQDHVYFQVIAVDGDLARTPHV
jgi:hypothetical protein